MEFFRDNGYSIVEKFISPQDVEKYIELLEKICDNPVGIPEENIFRMDSQNNQLIKQIQYLNESNEILKQFSFKVRDYIRSEFGNESFDIVNCQMFAKPPSCKPTSAHQDGWYFSQRGSVRNNNWNNNPITCWVALQDITLDNSCLYYVPGSHNYGLLNHDKTGSIHRIRTGVPGVSVYLPDYNLYQKQEIPMLIKAGDMLIHDEYLIHRSGHNITSSTRRALTCILFPNISSTY